MKNPVLFSVVSMFCLSSFADVGGGQVSSKIQVVCSTPAGFAGKSVTIGSDQNGQASVINLSAAPNGASLARGTLNITIFNGRTAKQSQVKVQGQYDDVGGTKYASLEALYEPSINLIYLNFSSKDLSYVEIGDSMVPMNCVQ